MTTKFLDIIFDEFSKSQPDLIINEGFFHSDETAQHFKQKYSLCTMTLIDGNVVWDFSATCHGKGDIDGLGGTCKHRVCEKTLARTTYLQNSIDFAKCAAAVLPRITIVHCSTTDVEEMKAALDNSWHTNNGTTYSIPQKAYYLRNINHNTVGFQTMASDASDYAEFSFRTGKFVQKDKTMSTSLIETRV